MSEQVGWIGLGQLGLPMASNLLEKGYGLKVYNRTAAKAEPLVRKGAQAVQTPAEAVTLGGIVVSVVWDSTATEQLVRSEAFLDRLAGGIHIVMCTGSPDAASQLAALHAKDLGLFKQRAHEAGLATPIAHTVLDVLQNWPG